MKINQAAKPRVLERLGEDIEVFRAPSESSPGTYHYVFRFQDARGVQCTCRGWQTHRYCWHSQNVPSKESLAPSPVVLEETGERVWEATKANQAAQLTEEVPGVWP